MQHNQPTVNDMMQAYAEDAVEFAQLRFQLRLDYTEASIIMAERVLGQLHDTLPKGALAKLFKRGPTPDELWHMAKMWGGYIGEVMRRQWGGEWSTQSQIHAEPTITLRIGDAECYPPSRVYKRLTNGIEDSIETYYRAIKQNH